MPKTKKDPNKPKGAKTAFMFFVEAERVRRPPPAGEKHEFGLFTKSCGELWQQMSEDDKIPYQRKSDQDKVRHQREMENYFPESDSDDDEPRKKKKKAKKDPNKPKRGMSAYFFYAAEVRPGILKENPGLKITEVATEIGKRWKLLAEDDKIPFQELAAKDKARYEREMKDYRESEA